MSGRLFELGFFEKFNDLSGPEKQKAVFDMTRRLLPHQIGHFVGMDVHDWSNEGSPGMGYRKDSFLVFILVNVQLSGFIVTQIISLSRKTEHFRIKGYKKTDSYSIKKCQKVRKNQVIKLLAFLLFK